jgi:uncharacterized membrane protein
MAMAFILPAVTLLILKPTSIKQVKRFVAWRPLSKMVVMSGVYWASILTIWLAYAAGGEASQIMPLSQVSIVMTVGAGYLWLRERDRLGQKLVGSGLVMLGAWLLV